MDREFRHTGHARPDPKADRDKGNEALREIAWRLKKLSYRDMRTLVEHIAGGLTVTGNNLTAEAMLAAADALETA